MTQFRPEIVGNSGTVPGHGLSDMIRVRQARDHAGHDGVREHECQRGGGQRNAMGSRNRLHPRDALDQSPGRGIIIVADRASRPRAGHEDAAIIRPPDNNLHAGLGAGREQHVQRVLLEQGIAPGEQQDIDRRHLQRPDAHRDFVHPQTEGLDGALVAQPHQRVEPAPFG